MIPSVSPDYVHYDKLCTPGEPVRIGDARLKWYDIAPAGEPVSQDVCTLARAFAAQVSVSGDLGFVILHKCGNEGFHFLLVQTWCNENEMWESVYSKLNDATPHFGLHPLPSPHHGAFCVWELAVVWWERQAWRRYLGTDRSEAAKLAYLSEAYAGSL